MLSKEKCVQAINKWEETKSNYSEMERLINPTSSFNFNRKECDWLNENNDNSEFHTYMGIHDDKVILIVVPIDKNGKEKDLTSFLTSTLTVLNQELTLVEVDVVTTTRKTVLSRNLQVTKLSEEIDLPTYNEPVIKETASVDDIVKWKNDCLNWFYNECNHYKGKRIFKTFNVPFSDLVKNDDKHNEVKALFGFKHSDIYERLIPVLIFVATDSKTAHSKIIRSNTTTLLSSGIVVNAQDWSQPCPPMCATKKDYLL